MSVSPQYETYEYTARGPVLRAQSIVECRLEGRADDRLLALSPRVVYGGAEVLSGEVRYGGKLFFSAVLASPDGSVAGVERGAEFSHRAPCEDAAPAQRAEVALHVEKAEYRLEGRSLILSAIVTADMVDNDGSEAIRIALIVILTVLALLIIGVYIFLLPREKYRKRR